MLCAWAAVVVFAAAAIRDLLCRCIDDGLVVVLLLLWGVSALADGMAGMDALLHLAAAAGAFLVLWGMFAMGWMGGGDVKLAAAVFLWAGPGTALGVAAIVSIIGLAVALLCLAADLTLRFNLPAPVASGLGVLASKRGVPYGIALAAGGIVAALASLAPGG